ncbi:MAG: NUDIX domain-containing protein [Proteobacteria bacterium]|nr:NUDIX domain-containing protein [Pseudomonadota bacterium]MBU4348606.1 NUDIX domain-containing protein [Patescibacteria group bacterium]
MREISGGIIIYKRMKDRDGEIETKYLLLYNGRGYWNFPKGKIEREEKIFEAALRETSEETGISALNLIMERSFKESDRYIYWRDNKKIFKLVVFYLAQSCKEKVKLSNEHEGYGWFLYKDANKLLRHHNIRNVFKKADDYLKREQEQKRNSNKNSKKIKKR